MSAGNPWQRRMLMALIAVVCCGSISAGVLLRERARTTVDLDTLAAHFAQLQQRHERLQRMPPSQPVHEQIRRLRALAQVLPNIVAFQVGPATPDNYSAELAEYIGHFGGTVWKVAMKGSLLSLAALCRTAQSEIPLVVDSIRVENDTAHVLLYVLGAPANSSEAT